MVDENNGQTTSRGSRAATALEQFIAEHGPLSWKECLRQFHDVCYALEGLKANEHGRIKMSAFSVRRMGDGSDFVIELDTSPASPITGNGTGATAYGASTAATEDGADQPATKNGSAPAATRFGDAFPDEAYMSPEQCLERPVDIRSDIYSLGCVMYYCMTGSPPFVIRDGERQKELQVIDYPLMPGRRSQRLFIPDEIDLLIKTCMAKDPNQRFDSAAELRADIGKSLQLDDPYEDDQKVDAVTMSKRQRILFTVTLLVGAMIALAGLTYQMVTSDSFAKLVTRSKERNRNRYLLSVESGPQYLNQMEFKDRKIKPEKDPLELKQKGQDIVLFATTMRSTVREALEEAVRRRILLASIDLGGQDLRNAKLVGAVMPHAYLGGAVLDNADLSAATLENCYLDEASLRNCKLVGTNLVQSSLHKAVLEGSNLSNALLIGSDLSYANFKNTILDNANLSGSNLDHLDLAGASMQGTVVSESMTHLVKLSDEQRASIRIAPDAPPSGYNSR